MITRFLLHIIANSLAILAAEWLVPGVIFEYNFVNLMKVAVALAIANAFIKPALKLLSGPLILLTLGLFTVIVNLVIIWLVDYFLPEITIGGFNAYFWTMIIISAFNFVVSIASKEGGIFTNN
jgi:putative membrane protein